MIDEIAAAGFRAVELGYDLRRDLVDGVEARVREGAAEVVSVHAYCPVPANVPRGHPELWLLADADPAIRQKAVAGLTETLRFAASVGARAVVVHGGYIRPPWSRTSTLIMLARSGRRDGWMWRWHWNRLTRAREQRAARHLGWLREGLARLDAVAAECRVCVALENLPSWEAVPSEVEAQALFRDLPRDRFAYWHDFGHGQIRQNLGFTNHLRLLERMRDLIAGFHVHDVEAPATDHVLPPNGMIPFHEFAAFADLPVPFVIEPPRDATPEALREAVAHVETAWGVAQSGA